MNCIIPLKKEDIMQEFTQISILIIQQLAQVMLALLVTDFLAGIIHWAMDSYGSRETPLIGGEIAGNRKHHLEPKSFTKNSWWQNAKSTFPIILILTGIFYSLDFLNTFTLALLIIGWNSNEIHKWAHQGKKERALIGTILQKFRLIQCPKEHQKHHSGSKNSHYCPVSPFVNPVLEFINFWRGLEWIVLNILGYEKVIDPSVKN